MSSMHVIPGIDPDTGRPVAFPQARTPVEERGPHCSDSQAGSSAGSPCLREMALASRP
jgi:hypothetical protein